MDMIDILESKIKCWNQENADLFHQMANRDSHFGKYIWESTPDGFFLLRDVCSIFFKNDGKIYKLTSQYEPNDWELHCKLYERISNYADCKIEIPLYHKKININEKPYLYSVVQRYTTEYNFEITTDAMMSNITDDYMLEWIDHTAIILSHMKAISPLLPRVYPKRLYNGTDHFWIDFKKWEIPIEESIYKNIGNLYRTMLRFKSSYGIDLDKQKILSKAGKEWKH